MPTMLHGLYVSFCLPQIIANQLVDALIEIHSKGVFHRDIKLENILLDTSDDDLRIWIIDFGCGQLLQDKYTDAQGRPPLL